MRHLNHSPKTVALIGMGPSITDYMTATLTQEFKPDFADEIWVINMAANCLYHDVVFWMDDLYSQETFRPGLITMLRRRNKPVITSKAYPDLVSTSYDFPLDEVGAIGIKAFGKPYLTNGVAQAIGYAMWKGVTVLKVYGADFSYPNRDYAESGRACVEAWITLACERRMEIRLSPRTSLFDAVADKGVYGYTEQPEIRLPDGSVYKYVKAGETPAYTPEDSSGEEKKHESVSGSLPGAESGIADPGGSDSHHGNGLDETEAPAASGLGESVQHQDGP